MSWTGDAWPLKDLAYQQRDCVGFKGLEMNTASLFTGSTYCLPSLTVYRKTSWESRHGAGKCGRVGPFPIQTQWGSFPVSSALSRNQGCYVGSSALSPTLPTFLINFSLEWDPPGSASSPSFIDRVWLNQSANKCSCCQMFIAQSIT